jgi:hypothetical protein
VVVAIALCAVTAGCSNKNDVVATQRLDAVHGPDGSLYVSNQAPPCEPGSYSGTLFAMPGDGGIKIQYSGRLNFAITQSRSGEFQVTNDTAQLSGMGDDGTTFQAEIFNGQCKQGVVEAILKDGKYTYFTNLEKTATAEFTFDGTIRGRYESEYSGFIGKWTTALHLGGNYGDLIVAGTWSASRAR